MTTGRAPRSRFYDGGLYARIFDRLLSRLHDLVVDYVEPVPRVLDVGCGTGDMVWRLTAKADEVVGIELSPAMVDFANETLARRPRPGVSFVLGDVTTAFADLPEGHFDLATMVLALHEMPPDVQIPVMLEVTRLARQVLCVDFRAPMPWSVAGIRNRLIEMSAGIEHYRAHRQFQRAGATQGVARAAGLVYELVRPVDAKTMEIGIVRRAL